MVLVVSVDHGIESGGSAVVDFECGADIEVFFGALDSQR